MTYGESCTKICDNHPELSNCFSQCSDLVRSQGYDATTCCQETWGGMCQKICAGEYEEDKQTCLGECVGEAAAGGAPADTCVIDGL